MCMRLTRSWADESSEGSDGGGEPGEETRARGAGEERTQLRERGERRGARETRAREGAAAGTRRVLRQAQGVAGEGPVAAAEGGAAGGGHAAAAGMAQPGPFTTFDRLLAAYLEQTRAIKV